MCFKGNKMIDYDELSKIAREHKPKIIVSGASAYPRELDFKRLRKLRMKPAHFCLQISRILAGLSWQGIHSDPVPYADFVTTTPIRHFGDRAVDGNLQAGICKDIDKTVFRVFRRTSDACHCSKTVGIQRSHEQGIY